ncbi:dephospho-CoA kinase/protein folding accessory domain-containing protein [Paenibacillus sp. 32O-W]|uniref:GrpB family protein n=1 Tax=Paenibacillus sp. 32O-W TaxID=1695218 RepID=UPI000722EFB7|nr:GrpB family protein [Paenibacillus sp. 32O-W]ALS28769.1 dephospho-CoA kinase/protein folding accessory domain-containing protein [Paenibacillus sp. 32O-W]
MSDEITIESYQPEWPLRFQRIAQLLRAELGETAVRIDHIGSTSVPGLAAKPIIDIQISVRSFELFEAIRLPLERCGFRWRSDNPDLTKRYFREGPGMARTHIHVRREGSWSEQLALLFRDYLRCHEEDRLAYAECKIRLAERYRDDRHGYVEAKRPFIWSMMQKADQWSQMVGWMPGERDA